jgi:hypothetical protein
MLGEVRLIPVNQQFGRAAASVTGGQTDWARGEINLVEACALIARHEACWIWRDDRMIEEVSRSLPQSRDVSPAPPFENTSADIERRLARVSRLLAEVSK